MEIPLRDRLSGSVGPDAPNLCCLAHISENCWLGNISLSGVDIRTFGVLQAIRSLPGAIGALTLAIQDVAELAKETGPAEARLEELERSRASWEAEINAELMKADSTYKAAASAESRSRTMVKHAEKLADPFGAEGQEVEDGVPPEYAQLSPPEGLHDVRVDVAPLNSKVLARRLKFL